LNLSLRDQVRRAIRAQILTGRLRAGELYSAPSLSIQLGVSATPVREAMLDLISEGLVESVRNRGFRVLGCSNRDLDEILELRLLIEPPSVARAAGRYSEHAIIRLENLVDDIETAAREANLADFLAADREFHLGLVAPLANGRLTELVARFRDQQRMFGLPGIVRSAPFLATAAEHRVILDAAVSGRGEDVRRALRSHLRHARGLWAGNAEKDDTSTVAPSQRGQGRTHDGRGQALTG
jgi:DNA-binding GntR family transcriptional regulator